MSSVASALLRFHSVKAGSSKLPLVESFLKRTWQPLYGDHQPLLEGMRTEAYRCELLMHERSIEGILVYQKRAVENEGLKVFKFKVLAPFGGAEMQPDKIQQLLLNRVEKLAKKASAGEMRIQVPERDQTLLAFLEGQHFASGATASTSSQEQPLRVMTKAVDLAEESKEAQAERTDKPKSEKRKQREPSPERTEKSDKQPEKKSRGADTTPQTIPSGRPRANSWHSSSQRTAHEVTLKRPFITQIRSGKKTIEGRINSGMFRRFRQGDTVRFFSGADGVRCEITAIRSYRSFGDMLQAEGYQRCLPYERSLQDAINVYDRIPNYPQRAAQSGVLAIELRVLQ